MNHLLNLTNTKNTLSNSKETISVSSDKFLQINNLKKHFGSIRAVDGLSFNVCKGEIYGLLGPNGAGKTTTIKCILGLLDILEGSIKVFGFDPSISPNKVKEKVGYVGEEPLLYESLVVRELFNFIASVRKLNAAKAAYVAQNYLESLGALKHYNSLIATLSRGNKQKVQIIAALLHKPKLLILDEPLSGLDARSATVIKNLFQIHIKNGGSILLSTHIMEQAQALCTRIGIINNGKLVAEGTYSELQSQAKSIGASLEDIFLRLTQQDSSINDIIKNLQNLLV